MLLDEPSVKPFNEGEEFRKSEVIRAEVNNSELMSNYEENGPPEQVLRKGSLQPTEEEI